MLIFTGVDLQLYNIFKIMRVSFFGTQCILRVHQLEGKGKGLDTCYSATYMGGPAALYNLGSGS